MACKPCVRALGWPTPRLSRLCNSTFIVGCQRLPRKLAVKRHMDVFSRTFLPAAAEAGVAIPTVSRHLPVVRRCVEPDETTVLVGRCLRPEAPLAGEFMLVLT